MESQKSEGLAFALAFLLGPMGMFYAHVPSALAFLGLHTVMALFLPFVGNALIWFAGLFWAIAKVRDHNKAVAQASR